MITLENSLQESKISDHFETMLLIPFCLFCGHINWSSSSYDKHNNIYQLYSNEIDNNNSRGLIFTLGGELSPRSPAP